MIGLIAGHDLSRSWDFALFEGFDDVAGLQVLVIRETDSTFEASGYFTSVILEAAQTGDRALPDNRTITQESNLGPTSDDTVAHEASSDRPNLWHAEDFTNFCFTSNNLFVNRGEHPEHGRLDLFNKFVDDFVSSNLNAFSLSQFTAALVGTNIESNDGRV